MSNDCDLCGLDILTECSCHMQELEKRIDFLAEELDKLTDIVKKISDYIGNENVR